MIRTSPERTHGIAGNNRPESFGENLESEIHRAVDSAVKAILGHGSPGGGDGFDDDYDKLGKRRKSSKKKKHKKGEDS